MKWARTYSNNTRFFLKVDDDMIVNTYALLPFLDAYEEPVFNSLLCLNNTHNKVIRDKESKFYISEELYPDEYFPSYCNGRIINSVHYLLAGSILIVFLNRRCIFADIGFAW